MALACPYCYNRINARQLWFRCNGRRAPGKPPCVPQYDVARAELLDNPELVLPSFPAAGRGLRQVHSAVHDACGSESGIKVCPHCHSRLPATFGDGSSPLIAMAGARHTGKSVYLKVLAHQLRNGMGRRFNADIRLNGDAQLAQETGGGQDFLDPAGQLFPDHRLYARTQQATGGRREPIVFAWRQKRLRGHDTTFLSFFDTAGEDLAAQESTDSLQYLGAADALILLLDPFMIPQARDQLSLPETAIDVHAQAIDVVTHVTENLRQSHHLGQRKNIPIPVAVAFAKIDAFFDHLGPDHPLVRRPEPRPYFDEKAGRETHEYVRSLLHEWGAENIDFLFEQNYKRFRYFAVSALGAEPDYDNDLVDAGGVQPFRVDEPLLWLLSQFNVVPARG